jgi:two-component system chemotaxis sensor kinase CheA
MEGTQTELDKTIIEAIKDPLTHIVRNSLDHGLETPTEREASGKPPQGVLFLRAFHEGGQVNIEISDDGAGLDLEAIRAKAIERGMLSPRQAEQMSDREVANLIFVAGFSTAKKVTNISGRGVGMDVVKTNIEKIGGTVDISSTPGHGTTLKIKIPLTLAIIPALVVTTGCERFAIPQVSLVELVRLEGKAAETGIERIQEAAVYRLRGNLLPIIYLNRELNLSAKNSNLAADVINIVVLQADGRQFGLVVDEINDTEEIVVKPLSKQLKGIACFAGATIMGDGKVALILDILGLAQLASLAGQSRNHAAASKEAATQSAEQRESWLLFRVGDRGKLAVPLSMVSRLEEFDPKTVETSGNRQVVQYRGEIMPLISVVEALHLPAQPCREGPMQVVVHSEGGHSVGLVVDEILDIVDQHVSVTRKSEDARLLGSAVIQQHVTDLLNVPQLVISSMAGEGRTA